ncbi:hypothetical protein AB9D59_10175 [Blautia producta]|uniref:hypothetical protein n=1 Tax=Blautia producta TaxID=33035 RepID=UPI0035BE7226
MKKYLFFDTTWNQMLRVGNMVANHMKEECEVKIYGLVFETSEGEVLVDKGSHCFDNVLVSRNINEVNKYIKSFKPDVTIFAQNTVPDLDAIWMARKNGSKIVMMQHGLLYDGASLNNVRTGEIFAALLKAKKTFGYLNILRRMCKEEKKSFVKALMTVLAEKYNVTTIIQNMFEPPLRGEVAFVIGEYWVDYYHDSYGYDKKDIYIMGNHDVDDLDMTREVENAICYIPSVHVEDGKVLQDKFEKFLKVLAASIPKGTKFYVKFHPRSNTDMYYSVFENTDIDVEYVQGRELPYVRTYIGHNSSLLSKALQISGVLILWGFNEEKELFYRDMAYAVCENEQQLKDAIRYVTDDKKYSKKAEIERFSYLNPVGAYKYCANKILEIYEGE